MRFSIVLLLLACSLAHAQIQSPFSRVSMADILFKKYERDTSADAVILNELGNVFFESGGRQNLLVQYHVRIRIMRKQGLQRANFSIPLRKGERESEQMRTLQAVAYNLGSSTIEETRLNEKDVFTDDVDKRYKLKKFAVPNVRVGTVIDVTYEIETPFIFNFWPWEFQCDVPKLKSEYRAQIPDNYIYNVALKGPYSLSKNESSIVKDCFQPGGQRADCVSFVYAMEHIPAFRDEEYMTAKSNFLSAINFELSEIRHFNGLVKKYTSEWKDVNAELLSSPDFGLQVKRNKDLFEKDLIPEVAGRPPLQKAKAVYKYVANRYNWNEHVGKYCELGVKKAYESKTGNVSDINLSLVAALQSVGIEADPVILSTRANGLPTPMHPVISDFNYVIALVVVEGKKYLLDATENLYGFGMLPERCLNAQGRRIGKETEWVELKPIEKKKETISLDITLDADGKFAGQAVLKHYGYNAAEKRQLFNATDSAAYVRRMMADWGLASLEKYEAKDLADVEKPFVETMDVLWDGATADRIYFSPFLARKWRDNPFKSPERSFPVDFGAPIEQTVILNLNYPADFEITEAPSNVALSLSGDGGKYFFSVSKLGNKVSISSRLSLNKNVYTPEEYHALRELFTRILQLQESIIVFSRKK